MPSAPAATSAASAAPRRREFAGHRREHQQRQQNDVDELDDEQGHRNADPARAERAEQVAEAEAQGRAESVEHRRASSHPRTKCRQLTRPRDQCHTSRNPAGRARRARAEEGGTHDHAPGHVHRGSEQHEPGWVAAQRAGNVPQVAVGALHDAGHPGRGRQGRLPRRSVRPGDRVPVRFEPGAEDDAVRLRPVPAVPGRLRHQPARRVPPDRLRRRADHPGERRALPQQHRGVREPHPDGRRDAHLHRRRPLAAHPASARRCPSTSGPRRSSATSTSTPTSTASRTWTASCSRTGRTWRA